MIQEADTILSVVFPTVIKKVRTFEFFKFSTWSLISDIPIISQMMFSISI